MVTIVEFITVSNIIIRSVVRFPTDAKINNSSDTCQCIVSDIYNVNWLVMAQKLITVQPFLIYWQGFPPIL